MRLRGLLVGAVAGLALAGRSASGADAETPVVMSPYEVTARTVEFRGWTKLRSPNFVVYTDARPRDVRRHLQQMEMMRMASQVIFGRRPLNREPAMIVLPTSHSDWRKLRSKGSVQWKVAVSGFDWFVDGAVVEYDWQADGLHVLLGALGASEVSRLGLDLAFPLAKGVGHFFETAKLTKDGLRIGNPNSRVAILKYRSWFDWEHFFRIRSDSAEFTRDSEDVHRFAGQATLFVHYVLTRHDQQWTDRLLTWNAWLQAGREPTDELFKSVFGQDWAEWQTTMRNYLAGEKFKLMIYDFPPETMDFVVTEVEVRPQEMRDLFVLVQIINQRIKESDTSLEVLLERGLATEELRPLLVEACLERKRPGAALAELQRMIEVNFTAAEGFATAAALYLAEAVGNPTLDSRLSSEQAERLRAWCGRALEREPFSILANETLAWAVALAPVVTESGVATIKGRCDVLSGNGRTDGCIAALAVASWRQGDTSRARRACELLLESPFAGRKARQIAEDLLPRVTAN